MSEATEAVKRLKTKARRKVFAIGNSVVEVSPFKPIAFFHRAKELRFQNALINALKEAKSPDAAIEKACFDINESVEWANKYFSSPRYKRWLEDRTDEIEANSGLTVGFIQKRVKDTIDGVITPTPVQHAATELAAKRLWPEVTKTESRVEVTTPQAMDDLMKSKAEVDALETRLKAALQSGNSPAGPVA